MLKKHYFGTKWSKMRFLMIFWTILKEAQKFFLLFTTRKIWQFFFFLQNLIKAKMTFADFFTHSRFGGFSNKILNDKCLGIVFDFVQEKVDLGTLLVKIVKFSSVCRLPMFFKI